MSTQTNEIEVKILVDDQEYTTSNSMTGAALHKLAGLQPEQTLFRESPRPEDDDEIDDDEEIVSLQAGERLRRGLRKGYKIIINGQEKVVRRKWVTFAEIVSIAFPTSPGGQDLLFTITYEDGPKRNPEGSLLEGGKVKVKNGMIFNVTATNRS